MRTIYIGDTTLAAEKETRVVEYNVVICDLLDARSTTVGESYGISIRMTEPVTEGELLRWSEADAILDITTKHWEILDFAAKLQQLSVTPSSLRDIVYDSLPL